LFELQLLNEIYTDFLSICQSRIFSTNILTIHQFCVLHHFLLIIFDVYIIEKSGFSEYIHIPLHEKISHLFFTTGFPTALLAIYGSESLFRCT